MGACAELGAMGSAQRHGGTAATPTLSARRDSPICRGFTGRSPIIDVEGLDRQEHQRCLRRCPSLDRDDEGESPCKRFVAIRIRGGPKTAEFIGDSKSRHLDLSKKPKELVGLDVDGTRMVIDSAAD